MLKIKSNRKTAFTLAETLITIVILGILAAILVPNLIKKQIESSNRTKIKKAMAAYEKVIDYMIIENDSIRGTESLDNWARENDCETARGYFKITENGATKCQFKTSDGLWWDMGKNGKMSKAIVAFKKADLTAEKAMDEKTFDAFYFMTLFEKDLTPRVLDMGYAYSIGSSASIINNAKILAFLNNKEIYDYFVYCDTKRVSCIRMICGSESCSAQFYDNEGKHIIMRELCDKNGINCTNSEMPATNYPELDNSQGNIYKYAYCNKQGECDNAAYRIRYDCYSNTSICSDFFNDVKQYVSTFKKADGTELTLSYIQPQYYMCSEDATSGDDCTFSNFRARYYDAEADRYYWVTYKAIPSAENPIPEVSNIQFATSSVGLATYTDCTDGLSISSCSKCRGECN